MDSIRIKNKTIVLLFLAARLILLISVPYQVVPGYGDYWNFFSQAKLGLPFVDYWTEFPPFFPFVSKLIYYIVSGRETAYSYLLAFTISLFQAGSIGLVLELGRRIHDRSQTELRAWSYLLFTVGLFYSWSYFDPIAVFFMLLGIYLFLSNKKFSAIGMISLGALTKWFPVLAVPALWKGISVKRAVSFSAILSFLILAAWGGLYLQNSEYTIASLGSQLNKGSWESLWALIDGNLMTGNFSPEIDRTVAGHSKISSGNPAIISPYLTFLIFGGLGLFLWINSDLSTDLKKLAFIGLTLVVFFIWSPGYSPQWILYILPFSVLCLEFNEALLFSAILLLLNLLEWPVLLSRGYFESLYYLIPARSVMMVFLGERFYARIRDNSKQR